MAGRRQANGTLTSLIIAVCTLGLCFAANEGIAEANKDQYPSLARSYWKSTNGSVRTDPGFFWEHNISENFMWDTSVSLLRLDAPRTPTHEGTYEHELRFNGVDGRYWCDAQDGAGIYASVIDLPGDWYEDKLADGGEFSWGMPGWSIVQDHEYNLYYDCRGDLSDAESSFNLTGQIGHCHNYMPCDSFNTYADETSRLIPRREGVVVSSGPVEYYRTIPPQNNSFESTLSPWAIAGNGTLTRSCLSSLAYHNSCRAIVTPSTAADRVTLYYTGVPSDPALGTASMVNEFHVRCPASNPTSCTYRLIVTGLNANGAATTESVGSWQTIPNNSGWYYSSLKTLAFGAGTTKWKFKIQTDGHRIDTDYTLATWHLPS